MLITLFIRIVTIHLKTNNLLDLDDNIIIMLRF